LDGELILFNKNMLKKSCGLSLIELLVSMILMSLVILGLSSIDLFSRHHVISSDRRVKVQNEISYAIEHMSKYVQQSSGNLSRPAIEAIANGFRVYVDLMATQTPSDFTDDSWIDYTLASNTLTVTCNAGGGGGVCPFATENLSDKIIDGVDTSIMPESPDKGFYVSITDGTMVDIGLVGRYKPTVAASATDNPQISMKTRLISLNSSAQ
jgi:Tfp pilus assembly protein PilV